MHCNTHCSTLQHIATHCNIWAQHTATHCNTMQHNATQCNTLQCTAMHCNAQQYTASKQKWLQSWPSNTNKSLCNTQQSLLKYASNSPVWCSLLQRVAVSCSEMQCVATCCSVLPCIAVSSVLQWATQMRCQCSCLCCSKLQWVAACCNVLQCVSVSYSYALQIVLFVLQRVAAYCHSDTLQIKHHLELIFEITATRCNTLQHTATYCNTLQHTATHTAKHTATHCNTLSSKKWLQSLWFENVHSGRHVTMKKSQIATHCNSFQLIASHCNALQFIATHITKITYIL